MKGINITIPGSGSSFSALNLGNINPMSAFFTAAGINDQDIKDAVNQLYFSLYDAGFWQKMDAIYPFVGGTAQAHKFNLKSPLDTDGAYRLTFANDVVGAHTSAGYVLNGTDRYANTHYLQTSFNQFNIGVFNSTPEDLSVSRAFGGCSHVGASPYIIVFGRNYASNTSLNIGRPSANRLDIAGADKSKTGLLIGNRSSDTSARLYDDGAILGNQSGTMVATPTSTNELFLGAYRNASGVAQNFSAITMSFAFFGGQSILFSDMPLLDQIIAEFQSSVR